jgi:SAM-dependent methyltransferase
MTQSQALPAAPDRLREGPPTGKLPTAEWYRALARPEMLPFVPARRDRVLEVGCGQGRFIAAIPDVTERWGIEPDAAAAAAAQTRLTRVIAAPFDDARPMLPCHYFDIVICNDVIEHMVDHDRFLEEVKDFLAPGGALVASIPNVRYYLNLFELIVARDWEYRDWGILDRTHLRFFTERSLRRTLAQHGWRIEVLAGINGGIRFGWNRWDLATSLAAYATLALGFGRFGDIRHQQFAVRAVLAA